MIRRPLEVFLYRDNLLEVFYVDMTVQRPSIYQKTFYDQLTF